MKERGANGLRRSPFIILTDEDIQVIRENISAIKADERIFRFNAGASTGYIDSRDIITVRGDILPDNEYSTHPRDLLSIRAVLAHEYYGHRMFRNSSVAIGAWNDEFRASYTAAKKAPGLNDQDRMLLILDAMERAKEAGIQIRLNRFMRGVLYGID